MVFASINLNTMCVFAYLRKVCNKHIHIHHARLKVKWVAIPSNPVKSHKIPANPVEPMTRPCKHPTYPALPCCPEANRNVRVEIDELLRTDRETDEARLRLARLSAHDRFVCRLETSGANVFGRDRVPSLGKEIAGLPCTCATN